MAHTRNTLPELRQDFRRSQRICRPALFRPNPRLFSAAMTIVTTTYR